MFSFEDFEVKTFYVSSLKKAPESCHSICILVGQLMRLTDVKSSLKPHYILLVKKRIQIQHVSESRGHWTAECKS